MNDVRLDRSWTWNDVAERAGVAVPTLKRFRNGHRTPESTRKIERAFGWGRGHIEAIVNGEPLPEPELAEAESSDLDQMVALDAQWTRLISEAEEMQRQMRTLIEQQKKLAHKQPAG